MKLIIQIPCYNEEKVLPLVLKELPRKIKGIKKVDWLVIDDGSTDKTVSIAKKYKVDHIVSHTHNKGLAKTFMTGINESLLKGADVIVNIDADNQYDASYIEQLVQPILKNDSEIVIGERPIDQMEDFSYMKKKLQKIGSSVVRFISNTNVPDATSGFRAYSKEAAKQINIFSDYTYTVESLIQAGQKNIQVRSLKIKVNKKTRESRLMNNMFQYIYKTVFTMLRMYVVYKPLKSFMIIGGLLFTSGFLVGVRWVVLVYWLGDPTRTYLPSLILSAVLMIIGFQTLLLALLSDLFSINRRLLEDIKYRLLQRKD